MGTLTLGRRTPTKTVLVIIEEPTIRDLISVNLRNAGFYPVPATSTADGNRLLREVRPDVVLIDLDSASARDPSFADDLKLELDGVAVPTVMVTADIERSCGPGGDLCGAAMCVGKPYAPGELASRMAKEFRSPKAKRPVRRANSAPLRVGPLEVNMDDRTAAVRTDGGSYWVDLPPGELRVLRCLMEHASRAMSREQVVQTEWGPDSGVDARTVDQYVARLRAALRPIGASQLIRTVRGIGYRFDAKAPLRRFRPDS